GITANLCRVVYPTKIDTNEPSRTNSESTPAAISGHTSGTPAAGSLRPAGMHPGAAFSPSLERAAEREHVGRGCSFCRTLSTAAPRPHGALFGRGTTGTGSFGSARDVRTPARDAREGHGRRARHRLLGR